MPSKQVEDVYNARRAAGETDARGRPMGDILSTLRLCANFHRVAGYPENGKIFGQAADEIERLRYVLGGVRDAITTGRNEPLVIWKEQIDIALGEGE